MIGRELAKAKIKKLRKMTTLAGCTPDEEASAAAKIAELMTKYRLNVMGEHDTSDLSVTDPGRQRRPSTGQRHHRQQ